MPDLVHSTAVIVFAGIASFSCAPSSREEARPLASDIVGLLAAGQPVFGIFSGEHSAEQGAVMGQNRETDFVFYSLESGPFDVLTMQAYMRGLAVGAGEDGTHPLALRIPAIRDGEEEARVHVQQVLDAGAEAIVFPHVETAEHAEFAVNLMGPDLWPGNAEGRLVNMLIVEDRVGVENAREIMSTPGVSVVFAGPGDLRRAYDRDMEAVENAIQTVLEACKEFDVPCGITAGVDDIVERLEQGFRVIIVTQPEALSVGRGNSAR